MSLVYVAQTLTCPLGDQAPTPGTGRTYTGEYENGAYGFAVAIPFGLIGLDSNNPAYQRGFVIVLENPRRTIAVYAEPNSLEYPTASAAATATLDAFRDGLPVAESRISRTRVGTETGAEVSFQYGCLPQTLEYAHQEVLALDRDRRYVYTIAWDGPIRSKAADQRTIEELVRTWRFLAPR